MTHKNMRLKDATSLWLPCDLDRDDVKLDYIYHFLNSQINRAKSCLEVVSRATWFRVSKSPYNPLARGRS